MNTGVNPMWVSIIVGILSSIISAGIMGAIAFAALKAWMARREEREGSFKERIDDVEELQERHALGLQDHESRISVLEDRSMRGQPRDYAPG